MGWDVKRFRACLRQNRIFFETVAASLLSIMAVAVSVFQATDAERQTRALELQTKIAEAQIMPRFELNRPQIVNQITGYRDDEYLTVSNQGGPVHDFYARVVVFFKVTAFVPSRGNCTAEVPINGYLSTYFVSASESGLLTTVYGHQSNLRLGEIAKAASELKQVQHLDYAIIEPQIVLQLAYSDMLNSRHEDFYEVRNVGGGTRLPYAAGKSLFEKWHAQDAVELSAVTAGKLVAIAARSSCN